MTAVPPPVDLSFDGLVAVVSGGASGIGAAIGAAYVAQGAEVVLVDRDGDAAASVAADIGARSVACDVANRVSVSQAVSSVIEDLGRVDVLVNSAGVARLGPAEYLSDEFWNLTMDVNLTGTFLMCQEFGRTMLARGSGRIINIASQAATVAISEHAAYCASKFGVLGLTKVLAAEWAGRGVTVNTISPTVVMTPLGREAWSNPKGDALRARIPVGRFAETDDVTSVAVFLASSGASMINGADVLVDGGYTIL
ncbi:MAG: D-threitol dehydrogenase [Rhodococcus sp. (in: high G+C Gram-positive bacteria)]|uniref:GolD/DthD family dehydrogenase n=1 Tax=Rhodococcus sp. EPR-157 TaxID=1813677 RepID=UPI0007BC15AE|nr:D-threitol dehydrogenase [Rhodococcus sp. EPR-157]KZF04566.1 short-chain dehydrogenase [Rhodococcus sp. EPR-157]